MADWRILGGCKPKTPEQRFEIYAVPVPECGCWLWQGPLSHNGYARFKVAAKSVVGSRYAWERFRGPIPAGMEVCHKCDTRCCVNPDHLFIGTKMENEADKVRKGRQSRGEKHSQSFKTRARGERSGRAVLSSEQVIQIRSDTRSGRLIGLAFGISQTTVWHIKARRTWRHI